MLENPQVLQCFSRHHHHQRFMEKKMHLTACYYKNRLGEFLTRDHHQGCILISPLCYWCCIHHDKEQRERHFRHSVP